MSHARGDRRGIGVGRDAPGFIDAASLEEVAIYLWQGRKSLYRWSKDTAHIVTIMLLHDDVKVSPAPQETIRAVSSTESLESLLVSSLSPSIHIVAPSHDVRRECLRKSLKWAGENPNKVRDALVSVENSDDFEEWRESDLQLSWGAHAKRHGGLFEEEYIPIISSVIGCSEANLRSLLKKSRRSNEVARLLRATQSTECGEMYRAYLASALLRGVYHHYYAQGEGLRVFHHPFRMYGSLPKLRTNDRVEDKRTNTEVAFASILLNSSLQERTAARRVSLWAESLGASRECLRSSPGLLADCPTPDAAIDSAVAAARRWNIRTHSKGIDLAADILAQIVVTGALAFTVGPFWASAGGVVWGIANQRANVAGRVVRAVANREARLRGFALPPGRIIQ
ncbi:hypothetical protein KKH27_13460 [bacterium]|nr:hypothetical protein [bacterium]MBU1984610.1 hypothetical protein [bacterium]